MNFRLNRKFKMMLSNKDVKSSEFENNTKTTILSDNIDPRNVHTIPLEILDELAARFVLTLPGTERKDLVRVCFAVEEAHWFDQNHYVPHCSDLEGGTMKEFAAHMFRHVPYLVEHSGRVEEVVEKWWEYKLTIPTYGAIILNSYLDKVLLVQSFSAKACWGFPKGKVNQGEEPHLCAAREVMKQVGYQVKNLIVKNRYIEQVINNQTVRLYIVTGVSEKTKFQPLCQGEIRDIKWFRLMGLPTCHRDEGFRERVGVKSHTMFLVIPFVREIRKWVEKERAKDLVNYPESRAADKTGKCSLLKEGFFPEAWKNFRLDQEDMMMQSLGFPGQFAGDLRINRNM